MGHKAREAALLFLAAQREMFHSMNHLAMDAGYISVGCPEGNESLFSTLALHSICAADNRVHIPHILFYHSGLWPIFWTTISSTARRSSAQSCALPVLTHQQQGMEIFLSVSLLGLQRKYQTGPNAPTNNGSWRSRSKALHGVDLQWMASFDSLLW